jgi:hypothetical protein
VSTDVSEEHTHLSICSHAHFLLSLLYAPEDDGEMFLRNVG